VAYKPRQKKSVGIAFALGVIFLGNFYIGQGESRRVVPSVVPDRPL
jgi:hypothetical protein